MHLPLLWYLPVDGRFFFGSDPGATAICVWGQVLFSSAIAAGAGGVAWRFVRRQELSRAQVWLSVGGCAVLLCFVVGGFAFSLWGRVPMVSSGLVDGR